MRKYYIILLAALIGALAFCTVYAQDEDPSTGSELAPVPPPGDVILQEQPTAPDDAQPPEAEQHPAGEEDRQIPTEEYSAEGPTPQTEGEPVEEQPAVQPEPEPAPAPEATSTSAPAIPKPVPPAAAPANSVEERPHVYVNSEHGFSLQIPDGWKVVDHTSDMKPRWSGWLWMVFTPQKENSKLTINLRHRRLDQHTTPEKFMKYNTYLRAWDRTTINGKQAFRTTQGSQHSKRLVHRTLIIDGEHIWMLNCIDETAGAPALSKSIFIAFVDSLSIRGEKSAQTQ